jgi:hypothetical protein
VLEIVYSAKLTENFYNATNSSKNSLSLFDNSLLQLKNDLENIVYCSQLIFSSSISIFISISFSDQLILFQSRSREHNNSNSQQSQ